MKNNESSKKSIWITLLIIIGAILIIGVIAFVCSNYVSKEFIYEQTKECRDTYSNIETSYLRKSDTLKEIFYSPKLNECVVAYIYNNPSRNQNGNRYVHTGYYIEGLSSNSSFRYKLIGSRYTFKDGDGMWDYEYKYDENEEKVFSKSISSYNDEDKAKIKNDRLKKIENLKRWY